MSSFLFNPTFSKVSNLLPYILPSEVSGSVGVREEREAGKDGVLISRSKVPMGGEFLFGDGRPHGGQHKVPAESQL